MSFNTVIEQEGRGEEVRSVKPGDYERDKIVECNVRADIEEDEKRSEDDHQEDRVDRYSCVVGNFTQKFRKRCPSIAGE